MTTKEELFGLPLEERLALVVELWDSIADQASQLELTEQQKQEIDQRLENLENNPGTPWPELKAELMRRL